MTEANNSSSLENINEIFKIPICYNDKVKKLNNTVITDLELIKSIETDETSIYDNVFKPSNKLSTKVIEQFANNYTTDTDYLKNTQQLIKSIRSEELNTIHNKHSFSNFEINDIVSLWQEIKSESGF